MKQSIGNTTSRIITSIFRILLLSAPIGLCGQSIPQPGALISESDQKAIADLAREVPLILSNEGWEAYANTFTMDYKNWSMIGDQVRERKEYLDLVKDWYDKGNRATGSTLHSIGFIPVDSSNVLYLYALREEFNSTSDSSGDNKREIRFVALYRNENGVWKNSFTAFMDKPKPKK